MIHATVFALLFAACGVALASRWRSQRALSASEAHYRMIFERSPQSMWVYDRASSRFLDVNDAAVRRYGYSREQFLAMTPLDLHLAKDAADFGPPLAPGEPRLTQHRLADGSQIDVEVRADSMTFDGRDARLILATDVTPLLDATRERERSASLRHATLEATADGIITFDRAGRAVDWNSKLLDILGLPAGLSDADVVEQMLTKLLHDTVDLAVAARSAADHAAFEVVELADGRILERYSQPQRLAGIVEGCVWSLRDVTQRERAIRQRRVLAAQFEGAFGAAPIGMAVVGPDDRWIQVNKAMTTLLGRTAEELVGQSSDSITHPDDRAATRAAFTSLAVGCPRTIQFEKRYLHKDGSEIWALVHATRMTLSDGRGDYVVSQVQDITHRRRADEALRKQALVFETIADAVIVADGEGRIIDANPAVTAIYGYERHELLGRTAALWQRTDEPGAVFRGITDALRARGSWHGEYGFITKDGRTGVVESTVKALRGADGAVVNHIGVMRDVTERRTLERHLLQAQKLEAIGSLAAGVAHEINTPTQYVGDNTRFLASGISSLSSLVATATRLADAARQRPELAAAVADFDRIAFDIDVDYLLNELPLAAEQSREGCDRIAEIVQAMKGFSHPGSGRRTLIDLNASVRNTATVSRNEWKYVAELTLDLDPELPLVDCYPGELQQVVLNLIINAAHAIAEARGQREPLGHIVVRTATSRPWVEIAVSDDGCGIPEAIRGKVFDPFFTTKTVGVGTGQGLSIGHDTIVRKHNGTLTFESEVGRGTTFLIRLPLDAVDSSQAT